MAHEIENPAAAGARSARCIFLERAVNAVQGCVIAFFQPSGRLLLSNAEALGFIAYVAEDDQGRPCSCSFTKGARNKRISAVALKTALATGIFEASGWLQPKAGESVWARLTLTPVHDESRELQGYVALIHDSTAKRAAESALYNSEQQFRMLVQGVRDYAIYMLDPEGHITNWNAGAALIKGYSADDIIGQHYSIFYTEEDRDQGEPQRTLETALRNNSFQNEAWRVRKDGSRFWASIVVDPIYDENHDLIGYAKITRDMTERKMGEERAARQRETQHQAQKLEALGRITGTVAHDFNNMLAIIRTAAEMLGSGMQLKHDAEHYIRMITDTSERAAGLTGQLLAFARQQPLRLEVFSPATRIDGLRHVIDTSLGSRNKLELQLAPDVAFVESDPSQFETAILNLVINARDAMEEGGVVTISASNVSLAVEEGGETKDWVAVEVRDSGSGIDPQVLTHIFEPFFTTKAVNQGTGLGLSQVYGYVKQSGGDVKVSSSLKKGTTFTLYLPPAKMDAGDAWDNLLTPAARDALATQTGRGA